MSMILNPYRYASGGEFSPLDISDCVLWLDGSDTSTMYDASSGGSLTTNGNDIARWEDKSGQSNHATQGTAAACPHRTDSAENGLTAAGFDGSDDYITFASSVTARTFFVVYERTGGTTFYGGFALAASVNGPWYSNQDRLFRAVSANDDPMKPSANGGTAVYYKDGSSFDASASGSFASGVFVYSVIGSSAVSFDQTRDRNYPDRVLVPGNFCEYIAYNAALSTADRESVEDYLGDKWGVTITH